MQFGCSTTLAALETAMHVPRSRLAMFCLVPTILFLTTGESRGWSAEGHMIVALVADRLLQAQDASAHKKLAELLATDKSNTWTKTDIAGEANWADVLLEKSPEGRAATAKWHYVKLDAANPDLTKASANLLCRLWRRRAAGLGTTASSTRSSSLPKSCTTPPPCRESG